jgi:formylglycine-generating enzyme required for sulfatase activity
MYLSKKICGKTAIFLIRYVVLLSFVDSWLGSTKAENVELIYTVSTLAGSGEMGAVDGSGSLASFKGPNGIAVDGSSNFVYVADSGNHKIRRISPHGSVITWAGSGIQGAVDGAGQSASFNNPNDVAVDLYGNVYVADSSNNKIRKIIKGQVVTTLGSQYDFYLGGYGPISLASLYGGVCYTKASTHQIFWLSSNGTSFPIAGYGMIGRLDGSRAYAYFNNPLGIAMDGLGNYFVADAGNNKIRKIVKDSGVITLAGSGRKGASDGVGLEVDFFYPTDVALDASGNLYVADTANNKIRKIASNGSVTTIAGSGIQGSIDGVGKDASFNYPYGIAVDNSGNVYVADTGNHKIRKLTPSSAPSPLPTPMPTTPVVVPQNVMVQVDGGRVPSGSPQGWIVGEVGSFFISKYEISWAEWKEVRSWAHLNKYDIGYFGRGLNESFPVKSVNWYDAVKWCNAKSEMEGLIPFYSLDGATFRTGEIEFMDRQFVDVTKTNSDGYRLPTVAEWQWAARGGLKNKGFTYSGSNNQAEVSKDGALGVNLANELGLHDMSGNVAEWVADRGSDRERIICGDNSDYLVAGSFEPLDAEEFLGFRIARNTPIYTPPSGSPTAAPVPAPQAPAPPAPAKKGKKPPAKRAPAKKAPAKKAPAKKAPAKKAKKK